MEPVFMVLSQSAATAAALAIDTENSVQDVDYEELRKRLLAAKGRWLITCWKDKDKRAWRSLFPLLEPRLFQHARCFFGMVWKVGFFARPLKKVYSTMQ